MQRYFVIFSKANIAVDELIKCVHSCADNDVPIMVAHVIIGFDKHSPNEVGVKNYEKVVKEAVKCGVKVAFDETNREFGICLDGHIVLRMPYDSEYFGSKNRFGRLSDHDRRAYRISHILYHQ